MKIGIIGATGKLGNLLVGKLTDKGEIPTAIIRNQSKLTINIPIIEKDIFSLTANDIKDFDILINTFNAPLDDPNQFITSTEHLIGILKETTGTRLVFAGGAGVLLVAENTMLVDTPEIPAAFKPIAESEVIAFKKLAEVKDFDWTYMAPPAMMEYEAPHTGTHYFSGNKLGINAEGKSFISYSDYADAIVEKIFEPEIHTIVGVYA